MPRGKARKAVDEIEPQENDQPDEVEQKAVDAEATSGEQPGRVGETAEDEQYISREDYEAAVRREQALREQLEDRDRQFQEREAQTQYVLGRQGQELGELRRMVTSATQPREEAKPRKRVKLDPVADDNFTETFENYLGETLAERDRRLVQDMEKKHQQDLENLRWEMGVRQDAEVLKKDYNFSDRDIREAAEYGTHNGVYDLQYAAFKIPRLRNRMLSNRQNGNGNGRSNYREENRDNRREDYRDERRDYRDERRDNREESRETLTRPGVSSRKVADELMKSKPTLPVRGGMKANDGDLQSRILNMSMAEYNALSDADRAELDRKARALAMAGTRQQY